MRTMEHFVDRFQEILDALDDFESDEDMDELNAQFEDILFLLRSINEEDEDAREEFEGALDEMKDLLEDYRALQTSRTEISQKVLELDMAIQMTERNMN